MGSNYTLIKPTRAEAGFVWKLMEITDCGLSRLVRLTPYGELTADPPVEMALGAAVLANDFKLFDKKFEFIKGYPDKRGPSQ